MSDDDFYVEDEPVEQLMDRWLRSRKKVRTVTPPRDTNPRAKAVVDQSAERKRLWALWRDHGPGHLIAEIEKARTDRFFQALNDVLYWGGPVSFSLYGKGPDGIMVDCPLVGWHIEGQYSEVEQKVLDFGRSIRGQTREHILEIAKRP